MIEDLTGIEFRQAGFEEECEESMVGIRDTAVNGIGIETETMDPGNQ